MNLNTYNIPYNTTKDILHNTMTTGKPFNLIEDVALVARKDGGSEYVARGVPLSDAAKNLVHLGFLRSLPGEDNYRGTEHFKSQKQFVGFHIDDVFDISN